MKTYKTISALIAASSLLFAATGHAQNIDTFPSWDGSNYISSWGYPYTATYGQTFTPTAGESAPKSITFAINNNGGAVIPFQAFVYKWTGTTITGPALFQSGVSSVPNTGAAFDNIKVNLSSTGHGGLAAGQQYVVFYTVTGLGPGGGGATWGLPGPSDNTGKNVYSGGSFVFFNNDASSFASLSSTWDGATDYVPDDLAFLLIFGPSTFTQYALTPNQYAVASALDHAVATNNPGIQNLVNFLGNEPLSYLPASFDMISGEEYTSIFNTQYSIAHLQNSAIFDRLAAIQAQEPGSSVGLVALDMASGGKTSSDGKDSKIVNQPVADNRWGFFATANGDFTDINGDLNASGFNYATEGLTTGVDYLLTPELVAGAYLAYEHAYTSLDNSGSADANGVAGGLYGSWFSNGMYVNGIVGGGYSGFTMQRQSVDGFARGDGGDPILNAAISDGYDFHRGAWTFGPTGSLEYDNVFLQSFTENGSLAPLSVNSQSENSLRTTTGAHVSYTTQIGGLTVRPDVHAAYQHEYDNTSSSLGAQVAGTNAAFVVQGPYLGRNSALAGAGVTVDLSETTSVSLDYEGQFGRENTTQSNLSLGLQMKF